MDILSIDPEILSLLAACFVVYVRNRFRLFFVLSARGNLLWTGVFTFLTVDFYLRRNETTFGIDNTLLLTVCAVITVLLIAVPNLIPSILRRGVG